MTLRELAEAIGAELVGEASEAEVLGVTGLETMAKGHVAYVADARSLAEGESGPALALLVPWEVAHSPKPLLRAADPRLAVARALTLLAPEPRLPAGVHPTALLGPNMEVGEGAAISAFCVIGEGTRIGRNVQLHPLVTIGKDVHIGDDTVIFPQVTLHDGVQLGARVVVKAGAAIGGRGFGYAYDGAGHVRVPHVGTVIIADDVDIGANVTIDRATFGATVIGQGTKIDNLVHVAHNVKIGRNCLLAGQAGISGSVTLGDGVMMAGQSGVADHVTLGDRAIAGARAAVMQDVPDGTVVYGTPARPKAEQFRIDAATRRLPELVRTVRELMKRVAALEKR